MGGGFAKVLNLAKIRKIHDTSMRILSEIGIKVNNEEILDLLSKAGARVNKETKVARIPEHLAMESIKKSKKRYVLYGREAGKIAEFGYGKQLFMSSGGQYIWIDETTGERRPGTLNDSRTAILIGDALEGIDIVGAFVLPAEIPSETRDIHLYAELIKNTGKPCFTWINNGKTAKYIIEMFKVVAGGEEKLRDKPMIEAFVEPISPLQFSREGLEILIEFAKLGLPVGFGPMAMTMATAPATLAGTIAQENAEILAGITISQLLSPGLPITYWGIPHIMDPATGNISFGSPEQGLMAVAITQIAKWYGFPVGVNVGLTDSKLPDSQNGLERGMTLLLGILAGADIFGHMGIVGTDQGASLAELIINDEMISYLRRIMKGFEVNKETIAFEVIRRVGVGGHFLEDEHTLKHFRKELWFPSLFDRNNWELWKGKGGNSILERAVKKKEEILNEHKIEPFNRDIANRIDEIVKEAEKDILGRG
ncbi:trimethylamine methyltransferase family protein [Candidatus Aerophobetes bacterium]|nr:trimethylamine methyltransferase family protein [Candidatus Aerophobetes bacterium]